VAKIVLGIGTSHAPQLITTVEEWQLRVEADRRFANHYFRCKPYSFDELVSLRAGEGFQQYLTSEQQQARHARNDAALDALGDLFAQAKIDLAVVVGNDQNECFSTENVAAFCVHRGETFENIPKTPEQIAKLPPGIAPTALGYCPPAKAVYRGVPDLAEHLIESLIASGFDVGQTTQLPVGPQGTNSIQHAFGFVFRRIMHDQVVPTVPVFVNTHYAPNRPRPERCLAFGKALAQAISSWPGDARIALVASGGLTHYVIDEEFDRRVLAAMLDKDTNALAGIDEGWLQSGGTAELKNWLPVTAAMNAAGLSMNLVDYVPCYRSEAGTGTAMAFASWS
jgi:hypothetical protein